MAKDLKKVVTQLKGAVVAHGKQAKTIEKHIKDMNDGPSFLNKLKEKVGAKLQDKLGQLGQAFSNGTGSARPNFEQGAQDAINNIRGGQRMGEMLKFGKRNSQKLDEVLKAVQKNNSGNAPQADFTRMASQQSAGMPPADPDFVKQTPDIPTTPGSIPEGSNIDAANAAMMNLDMGVSMGVKPKKKAKAEAKAYAAKKGIRGKARKEMIKEAKKNQSFDAATNTQSKSTEKADQTVDFGGSMHIDPPKAKTMKRDGTKVLSNQVKFPSYFKKLSQGMIAEGAAEGIANAGKMAYSKKMEKLKPAYSKKIEKLKPNRK